MAINTINSLTALITASKLGDIIEVKNILKTGNFSVNQTDDEGNIYYIERLKKFQSQKLLH